MNNLRKIVETIQRHHLRVVVIGGHAVNFHGYIRATEVVDLLLVPDAGYPIRLYQALKELNAFHITDEIDPATGIERVQPVSEQSLAGKSLHMVGTDYGYLDVFCFVPGIPDANVELLWYEAQLSNWDIRFVNIHWLRRLKQAAGRPIDEIDLSNLPAGDYAREHESFG